MSIHSQNKNNQMNQAQYPGFRLNKKKDGGGLYMSKTMTRSEARRMELHRQELEAREQGTKVGLWDRIVAFIKGLFKQKVYGR